MKLQNFKRIIKSDYEPDDQDLVEDLSYTINHGFEIVYDALNKKLTFGDNFNSTEKEFQVEVDSTGKPKNTTSFSLDVNTRITGTQVTRADNLTNSNVYPTSMPFITFTQNGTNIIVVNVSGLQANNQYRLRVIAYGS